MGKRRIATDFRGATNQHKSVRARPTMRVYPRACGGTRTLAAPSSNVTGLSPRMRGNLRRHPWQVEHLRSIPAHAGEPRSSAARRLRKRVYPRACGGTVAMPSSIALRMGLSPRMRGNRHFRVPRPRASRSIPAHAGEPQTHSHGARGIPVYPRACGGTTSGGALPKREHGLSPRMRGNHRNVDAPVVDVGSIPAHAGEPLSLTVYGGRCGAIGCEPMPATGLRPPPEPRQLSWCCCELGRSRNFPRSETQRCRAICTGCQAHPPSEI